MKIVTKIKCAMDVPKDALESSKVELTGIMHVKIDLLNGIGDIRPSDGQVLQRTRETVIVSGIVNWSTISLLGIGVNRTGTRFAISHTSMLKNLKTI